MSFESSKTLGGVGAILMVIGFLGFFGMVYAGLLCLVGIILVLIALKGFADHYQEGSIFNNALYGFITLIIGGVAFFAVIVVMVMMALSEIDLSDPLAMQRHFMDMSNLWTFIGSMIAALVVLFISVVVSAVLFRKSLDSLSARSGEKLFGTAGLLWLIGAVLSIVLVGFILIWISWILIAVGFFSIKTAAAQPIAAQPQQPPP
ncbi:MAG: DUF996 domain-containing protein [Candidatus Bathycorpusculaceae bacterium]